MLQLLLEGAGEGGEDDRDEDGCAQDKNKRQLDARQQAGQVRHNTRSSHTYSSTESRHEGADAAKDGADATNDLKNGDGEGDGPKVVQHVGSVMVELEPVAQAVGQVAVLVERQAGEIESVDRVEPVLLMGGHAVRDGRVLRAVVPHADHVGAVDSLGVFDSLDERVQVGRHMIQVGLEVGQVHLPLLSAAEGRGRVNRQTRTLKK